MSAAVFRSVRILNFILLGLWLALPVVGRVAISPVYWGWAGAHLLLVVILEVLASEPAMLARRFAAPALLVLFAVSFAMAGRQVALSSIEDAIENFDDEGTLEGPADACLETVPPEA